MDELLPRPKSIYMPAPVRTREKTVALPQKLTLPRWQPGLSLPSFVERRTKAGPAIFLTLTLALSSTAAFTRLYSPCVQVSVNGMDMGLIQSRSLVESAVEHVEARASRILGYDYVLEPTITYTPQLALREDQATASHVETYLFDQIGEIMQTSMITVNGQALGAVDDGDALSALLDSIMAPYVNDNTISAVFLESVSVNRQYSPTADLRELSELEAILTSNSMEQVDYTVQPGDTFSGIAYNLGMSMRELQALNPDVDVDWLHIGDVLTVSQAVPFLSVQTVDNLTYEGPVEFEIEKVPNDSMYQGDSKIVSPGVEGSAIYNADITYINGREQSRVINSTEVLTQPVTQVVEVGTKPRPKTMATGSFQWPLRGTLTSGYGNRYIFGSYSFHNGLDIAAPYGTTISAADGGKVIHASNDGTGYGLYVVIDHENGLKSYYCHCSSLLVRVGDRVYKGQSIARVGSTGNSTGNHC
ncbi:MAG: M23 family metallopeptidase, partial [Oscillospiraceae bacterium]|nr:M23 family metallopeptidase [Oscillospiraceae bacterium]